MNRTPTARKAACAVNAMPCTSQACCAAADDGISIEAKLTGRPLHLHLWLNTEARSDRCAQDVIESHARARREAAGVVLPQCEAKDPSPRARRRRAVSVAHHAGRDEPLSPGESPRPRRPDCPPKTGWCSLGGVDRNSVVGRASRRSLQAQVGSTHLRQRPVLLCLACCDDGGSSRILGPSVSNEATADQAKPQKRDAVQT